jgi:SAM-dependent methyltransferase
MSSDLERWEEVYRERHVNELPWNAGGPDPDLMRLVKAGAIPVGQALDIGTGPGHDAVFLIQHGFNVIGIDISPTAVILARENASNAGLSGKSLWRTTLSILPMTGAAFTFSYRKINRKRSAKCSGF